MNRFRLCAAIITFTAVCVTVHASKAEGEASVGMALNRQSGKESSIAGPGPALQSPSVRKEPLKEPANGDAPPAGARTPNVDLEAALKKLKLPGVAINLKERSVDVESSVCLREGWLELVACTKGTKEHESILVIEAKAVHVHTALLLLGAKPGNPAMQRAIDGENGRWVYIPPRGGAVDVSLVFTNKQGKLTEHPISDFITRSESEPGVTSGAEVEGDKKFPTSTFIFAGSHLVSAGEGPRKYLSDDSGDVISISTFGDELLCLPDIHSQDNGSLEWEVNSTDLPAVGAKVILRLRPQLQTTAKPAREGVKK